MVWISTGYEQQHLDFQSAILLLRTKTGRPYGMNASRKDKLIPNYLLVAAVNGFGVSWKCKFWKEKKSTKLNIRISEFSKGKHASSSCSAQDLETKPNKLEEVDLDMVPMSVELEEEAHGLEEYTFPKFAATYFQGSSTHTHIRRQLRHPLLYHDDKDNILVCCSLFMLNLLSPQPWLYRSHHPWVLALAQSWEPETPEPRR